MKPQLVPGAGKAEPRGATLAIKGVNFSVYSTTATHVWVCIYDDKDKEIGRFALEGPMDRCFCGLVAGIGAGARYGLRTDGPYDPAKGLWHDPDRLLVDPFAKKIDRPFACDPRLNAGKGHSGDTADIVPKSLVTTNGLQPHRPNPATPRLLYELNPRGYTRLHPEIAEGERGTLAALTHPAIGEHFKRSGIDTVELMPIAAFIDDAHLPALGLHNAWGYNPITYFALDPRIAPGGIADLRHLTDHYRSEGVRFIVDVVYNHTGESDENGPLLSMRGLDALTYYRHYQTHDGLQLANETGTGNVLQADAPEVQRIAIESMVWLVEQGGIDGFRFDLAPILGRGPTGYSRDAPLLELIRRHPLLGKCLLFAEPWDAGPGGYQLGNFGAGFSEWNDAYRDDIRRFWRGDEQSFSPLATRLSGSRDYFDHNDRTAKASVNFLAVHDGFTLADLVSYAHKHNLANGENNNDGHSHNITWNCGAEGPTDDPAIHHARHKDIRALLATLFVSHGLPLLQQGDEMGRTQQGNNNAYAQDNEITWVDWNGADHALASFAAQLSELRANHPVLFDEDFLVGDNGGATPDVAWLRPDGTPMQDADWYHGVCIGMWLRGGKDELLVWFNRAHGPVEVTPPKARKGWQVAICSSSDTGLEIAETFSLPSRTVLILTPGA